MKVSATEIKNNFGKYLQLVAKEEILITKNGRTVGKLTAFTESDLHAESPHSVRENAPVYSSDSQKSTYEEFLNIRSNSEERYEYIDGGIYLLPTPKVIHQKVLLELTACFYAWFKGKKCTPLFAPFDIELRRSEKNKNMVQPDLAVICDLDEKMGEDGYYKGVPVLVAEVVSPATKSRDYVKKLDLYMSCGVTEYWIVDPANREVHVFCFKEGDIEKNKTYAFHDDIRSFHFKDFTCSLHI